MFLGLPQGVLKRRTAPLKVAQGEREGHLDLGGVDDIVYSLHPIVEVLAGQSLAARHTRCIVSEARTPFWREGAQGRRGGRWTHLHIHLYSTTSSLYSGNLPSRSLNLPRRHSEPSDANTIMHYAHIWSYDHALYPYMVIPSPPSARQGVEGGGIRSAKRRAWGRGGGRGAHATSASNLASHAAAHVLSFAFFPSAVPSHTKPAPSS